MLPLDATGKKKVPEMCSFGKQTLLTAQLITMFALYLMKRTLIWLEGGKVLGWKYLLSPTPLHQGAVLWHNSGPWDVSWGVLG